MLDPVFHLSLLLSDISIRELYTLQFHPIVVANACVTIALHTLNQLQIQCAKMFTAYHGKEFITCLQFISDLYHKFSTTINSDDNDYLQERYNEPDKISVTKETPRCMKELINSLTINTDSIEDLENHQ
jgi:hypothetical protein